MSTPRVLLLNTNSLKPPVAPLALDYLAADLQYKGIEPVLADLIWSDNPLQTLEEELDKGPYVLIVLSLRNIDDSLFETQNFFLPSSRKIVRWIKENYNLPVVLGGCGFSILPEEVLRFCGADFGIWGEGEEVLAQLTLCLHEGSSYQHIPGLFFWQEEIINYNPAGFCHLPEMGHITRRDFINNNRYFNIGGQGNIETKRGCDQSCSYCADPLARGTVIRFRHPEHIVEELHNLLEQGIDCFHFCDSEFNLPPQHAKEVCRAIIASGLNEAISWYAYCSPFPFDNALAGLMKKAGCVGINFGVDSGSDIMLAHLGRNHTHRNIKEAAAYCHNNQIVFMMDLLLGGPGEDRKTVKETISFMKELDPLAVGISLGIRLYKSTGLYREMQQQGLQHYKDCLHGAVHNNENTLYPLYYLSGSLGEDVSAYIEDLTAGDQRFLSASPRQGQANYNYSQNHVLMDAVAMGYRGAYWHILRKVSQAG